MTTCSEILLFPEDALMPHKDSIPVQWFLVAFHSQDPLEWYLYDSLLPCAKVIPNQTQKCAVLVLGIAEE